jgi:hypothetical protein
VQKVDVLSVDGGGELGVSVQASFGGPPVIPGAPIFGQITQPVNGNSGIPVVSGKGCRPPGAAKPILQIVKLLLRDIDSKRCDVFGHKTELTSQLGQFLS